MSFSDLLNKPLPSAETDEEETTTLESADPEEMKGDIGDGEEGIEDDTEINQGDTTDEACDSDDTECEDGDDFEDDLEDPEGDVASVIDDELVTP